ncbi:MAG: 6,7-dimethyl-8-ribityllumazine synthase [Methanobacteriota archaeon]|nr:MAG: 6,7-dimethyl-8-ribityllumazine synthase [Euryarchaeota archaeon]
MNVVFVASEFNAPIPDRMVEAARAKAKALGVRVVDVVRVPGAWEIPLALRTILARKEVDAAVAIGAIVTGETKHDELIASAVARELMHLQREFGKPIGLGITGPRMTWTQAEARVKNAARAVESVVRMARASRAPRGRPSRRPRRGPK